VKPRQNGTATEAQGPGNFTATFRITDSRPNAVNQQQLSATGGVSIKVNEVNLLPELAAVTNDTVHAGASFRTTLSATNPDLPTNALVRADQLPAAVWTPVPGDVDATGVTATKSVSIIPSPSFAFLKVELIEE